MIDWEEKYNKLYELYQEAEAEVSRLKKNEPIGWEGKPKGKRGNQPYSYKEAISTIHKLRVRVNDLEKSRNQHKERNKKYAWELAQKNNCIKIAEEYIGMTLKALREKIYRARRRANKQNNSEKSIN